MKKRLFWTVVLIAYCAILVKVMVFKDIPLIRVGSLMLNFSGTHAGNPNFLPFKTILPYLLGEKGLIIAGINLIGNIILLVPIGFIIPFVYKNITWKKTLALAVASGLAIEGLQVLLHVGIFDIDDVILNGIGVVAGYWAFLVFARLMGSKKSGKIIIVACIVLLTSIAIFLGVFVYQHHRLPIGFGPVPENSRLPHFDHTENVLPPSGDLCNGTGGIGQIISTGNNFVTIKRKDGVIQTIRITDQTKIKTSAGDASTSDLKIGDRLALVVDADRDGAMVATTILVCRAQNPAATK